MRDLRIFVEHDLFFASRKEFVVNPLIIDVFKALQPTHVLIILADNNPAFTEEEFSHLDVKLGTNADAISNIQFCELKEINGDLLISQNPELQKIAREKQLELAYPAKAGMFRLQDVIKVANEMANAIQAGKKILFKYDFDHTMVVSKDGKFILNDFFVACVADFHAEFGSQYIQSGILSARAPDHVLIKFEAPEFNLISHHLPNFLAQLNEKLKIRENEAVKIDSEKDVTCLMDNTKETTHIFLSFFNKMNQLCCVAGKEYNFDCGSTVEFDIDLALEEAGRLFRGKVDPSQYTAFQRRLLEGVTAIFGHEHREQLLQSTNTRCIIPKIEPRSVLKKADIMKSCVENEKGNALCVLFDDSKKELEHITGNDCMGVECYQKPAEEIAFESTKFLLQRTTEFRKSKVTELSKKPHSDYSFFQKKLAKQNQQQERKLRAHSAPPRMKREQ